MSEITTKTFYPFTVKQLLFFEAEIKEAGGFDILMRKKEAVLFLHGIQYIVECDIEEYKTKYLTGIYESLQEYYKFRTPYVFWARMHAMLKKAEKLLC
jgi:hypothetical protein